MPVPSSIGPPVQSVQQLGRERFTRAIVITMQLITVAALSMIIGLGTMKTPPLPLESSLFPFRDDSGSITSWEFEMNLPNTTWATQYIANYLYMSLQNYASQKTYFYLETSPTTETYDSYTWTVENASLALGARVKARDFGPVLGTELTLKLGPVDFPDTFALLSLDPTNLYIEQKLEDDVRCNANNVSYSVKASGLISGVENLPALNQISDLNAFYNNNDIAAFLRLPSNNTLMPNHEGNGTIYKYKCQFGLRAESAPCLFTVTLDVTTKTNHTTGELYSELDYEASIRLKRADMQNPDSDRLRTLALLRAQEAMAVVKNAAYMIGSQMSPPWTGDQNC